MLREPSGARIERDGSLERRAGGEAGAGSGRTAGAALALSGALALVALWPLAAVSPHCETPREASGAPGATLDVACAAGPGAPLQGPARLLFGMRLDANRATPSALEVLPGIGPVRAAAIAAERCRRPFAELSEIEGVRGIGPRTRAGLQPWLEVADPFQARCPSLP